MSRENKMKAAFLYSDAPGHMGIEEVAQPIPRGQDVLLRVVACAICGTDGRMFRGTKEVTRGAAAQIGGYGEGKFIIGHEIVGVVEAIGPRVRERQYQCGDRVILVTSVGCGRRECRPCQAAQYNMCKDNRPIGYYYPGGLAEYMLVPQESVKQDAIIPVPKESQVPDEHLALVEPLSCVVNGQSYLDIGPGDFVAVVGAGPIGLMHAELARSKGAEVAIAEYSAKRLQASRSFGFDHYINTREADLAHEILDLTAGRGADVVILACSVKEVAENALGALAMNGRLSLFAGLPKDDSILTWDANIIHYKEISVYGAFASNRAQFEEALRLIVAGEVSMERIVTHVYSLDSAPAAMRKMMDSGGDALKVVVKP